MREKEKKQLENILKKQEDAEYERLIREQKVADAIQRKIVEAEIITKKQQENEKKIKSKQLFLQKMRKEQAENKEEKRKEKAILIEKKLSEIMRQKEKIAIEKEKERQEKNQKMREVLIDFTFCRNKFF